MRDFIGLNGHTVQFRPALYAPVAKLVRDNGVKGILSGEGSDESYIGYPWLIFDLRAFLVQAPRTLPRATYHLLRDALNRMRGRPLAQTPGERTAVVRGLHNRFEVDVEQQRIRSAAVGSDHCDSMRLACHPSDGRTGNERVPPNAVRRSLGGAADTVVRDGRVHPDPRRQLDAVAKSRPDRCRVAVRA